MPGSLQDTDEAIVAHRTSLSQTLFALQGLEEYVLVHPTKEEGRRVAEGMARAAAQGEGDRGAQRICVWGEKVTNMLYALLGRYQREGEAFLENTQVWVCSVCGFLYIGDTPPALCPVCKVPAWKFDKIEGRLPA